MKLIDFEIPIVVSRKLRFKASSKSVWSISGGKMDMKWQRSSYIHYYSAQTTFPKLRSMAPLF